jgi:hypothetical protein
MRLPLESAGAFYSSRFGGYLLQRKPLDSILPFIRVRGYPYEHNTLYDIADAGILRRDEEPRATVTCGYESTKVVGHGVRVMRNEYASLLHSKPENL